MKENKGCFSQGCFSQSCACPFCEPELTNGCFSPDFCKPCAGSKASGNAAGKACKIKVCQICGAQYSAEYGECPSCAASK
ncbi:MAG: DNA repair protein RadA [Endomicrobia bacterium]|nr:DNA repair protein RadA [Endomicrobiia bacterium]